MPVLGYIGALLCLFEGVSDLEAHGLFFVYAVGGHPRWVFLPVIQAYTRDDPERAHEIAVALTGSGLAPKDRGVDSDRLAIEVSARSA